MNKPPQKNKNFDTKSPSGHSSWARIEYLILAILNQLN